jgi:hypothetical protein
MTMRLFAQITKVDQAKRLVYGRACQEVVDKSGEILDYAKSKPYFEAWSAGIAKDTDGKSLGNIRAMHGKVSAGKITAIDFNDTDKAIDICAKVVDDNEWNKVQEGCYTGYSIGGSYVGERTTEKMADGTDVKRYVANPTEISLVDQPCVPTAKFFDIVKADGAVEKVAFKEAAADAQITGTPAEVDEFAKALNDAGMTMADAIALVKKPPTDPVHPLDKGMWNVQDFAAALASISYIAAAAKDEAEWEGDASPVPEKLRGWLKTGVDIFKAMAKEEADELVASLKGKAGKALGVTLELHKLHAIEPVELTTDEAGEIVKAAPADLVKALSDAKVAKGTSGHMQKIHDMLGELGAKCAKAAPAGDLSKAADLTAKLTDALARIAALEKQPVPHVTLRAVAKGGELLKPAVDLSKITAETLTKDQQIQNADGSIDWATSLHVAREKALATAGNS